MIQYIKKNFLFNRVFSDNETLNAQAISWLARTANYLPHNYTKIAPREAFLEEVGHLAPYTPLQINTCPKMKKYTLRKTNVIAYKSNFYSLPEGTYKGPGSFVLVKNGEGKIFIHDKDQRLLASHVVSNEKGKTIVNTHHKRDTSKSIGEMAQRLTGCFTDKRLVEGYLEKIRQKYPRYIRDHFQSLQKSIETAERETLDRTLAFCVENNIVHGSEFNHALQVFLAEKQDKKVPGPIKLLNGTSMLKIDQPPQTSNLDDYDKYIEQ